MMNGCSDVGIGMCVCGWVGGCVCVCVFVVWVWVWVCSWCGCVGVVGRDDEQAVGGQLRALWAEWRKTCDVRRTTCGGRAASVRRGRRRRAEAEGQMSELSTKRK
jgi:hypothetical protein